jgi:hypothetical protein
VKDEIVDTRVRIPKKVYEQIKALAQREERSINTMMVILLRDAVQRATVQKEAEPGPTWATSLVPAY